MAGRELRIDPEPSAPEREAIARALARRPRRPATGERSAWWRAGVRELAAPPAGRRARG